MGVSVEKQGVAFVDRVFRLLERVEYRRADSLADKLAIYRLRHDAYMRAGTVERHPSGLFRDPLDEAPNVWIIGIYIDGDLASSIRLHVSASPNAPLPAIGAFNDILEPHLRAGRVIIDPTRHVTKSEYALGSPIMPYITVRATVLAQDFFDADYTVVACLVEHQAFFRRMFGCVPWSEPREYPNFNRPMTFLGYDCRERREAIYVRYPFCRSTEDERARLFSRSSTGAENVARAICGEAEEQFSRV
jgi:hypothetical protein